MIGELPLEAGGVKDTAMLPLPAVTAPIVGAPGGLGVAEPPPPPPPQALSVAQSMIVVSRCGWP